MIFAQANAPTSEDEIANFESQRGVEIPTTLREFLLKANGGYGPDPGCIKPVGLEPILIQTIHGLVSNPYESIHRVELGNFSSEIERQFLQIAQDPAGELFVIDLRPKTYGRIYIRAHNSAPNSTSVIDDTGFSESDYEEAMLYHPVAESFAAFLGMLRPDPT